MIIPRDAWGANPPKRAPINRPAGTRRGLVIHHNGPRMGLVAGAADLIDREAEKVRGIQFWHQFHPSGPHWSDVAYSWLVGQSGRIYEGRGPVWDQFANGSDQVGEDDGPDSVWYSVMWLGGIGETPTPEAVASVEWLIGHVRALGAGTRVLPHNAFKVKPCPGPELTEVARRWDGLVVTEEDLMAASLTPEQRDALLIELVARVRSMHMGEFGEADVAYNVQGSLAHLDRRFRKYGAAVVTDVVERLRSEAISTPGDFDPVLMADLVAQRLAEVLPPALIDEFLARLEE